MADKAISELTPVSDILPQDSFVLEQNGAAMRLTGQVLLNWLLRLADGHGGIQSIQKTETQGLVDTYTITLADYTTYEIPVTNGKGVQSFAMTGTNGLVDTYAMVFNDGSETTIQVKNGNGIQSVTLTDTVDLVDTYTILLDDGSTQTFTVTNGAKGDKGDNAYVYVKWASQEPTPDSHSFGDIPDNWMGIYSGNAEEAPTDYTQYDWYEIKGAKGNTGDAASLLSQEVVYQMSDSGTIYPSGAWSQTIPVVPAGKYLWTRITLTFNSGTPVVSYSVSRMGIDGAGAVASVAGISPDSNGNVPLSASDVNAMPSAGGDFTGPVNMNGQPLSGLNLPIDDDDAANKGYVDGMKQDFSNVVIPASAFQAFEDGALNGAGYGYRAAVALEGVTAAMMPVVVFSEPDAGSGLFASTAACYAGGVYVYATTVPAGDITVPGITVWKTGGPVGVTNAHRLYTAEEVGAAPAGYGLGVNTGMLISDCNDELLGGTYAVSSATANAPYTGFIGTLIVYPRSNYAVQEAISHNGLKCQRIRDSGAWHEWEWVNPPMKVDVEYRTTERYNGAAVYCKLIDCGASADNKDITFGSSLNIIRSFVSIGGAQIVMRAAGESATNSTYYASYLIVSSSLNIKVGTSMVNKQTYAVIYYLK